MRLAILLTLSLAACAELPPVEGSISPAARAAPFPELIPLDGLLAEAATPSRAAAAQAELEQRSARLRGVALPSPGTGDLAERGRRLRERAAALQAAPV